MELNLSENIRTLRKSKKWTQEQLAEALGVTVGAVYKWEAKLSLPELPLIVEMADLFDTSVDMLLGYDMKDNRIETIVERLNGYSAAKDREGLKEAEKALAKYPNDFEVVRISAYLYEGFAVETRDKRLIQRAKELFERSISLFYQNKKAWISEDRLYADLALLYYLSGEEEKAIETLHAHNRDGKFDYGIGYIMSRNKKTVDRSAFFLTIAMSRSFSELLTTFQGFIFLYSRKGDVRSLEQILDFCSDFLRHFRENDEICYLDKIEAMYLCGSAFACFLKKDKKGANKVLENVLERARAFDEVLNYDLSKLRFLPNDHAYGAYDIYGPTALQSVDTVIHDLDNKEFMAMWENVKKS